MKYNQMASREFLVIALKKGDDLTKSLQGVCEKEEIHGASIISGIGALSHCQLGYFDFLKKEYQIISIREPVELVSASGTITFTDGTVFPHIHLIVANSAGQCFGGHAMSDCTVSIVVELIIAIFDRDLGRKFDPETELMLLDPS